MNVCFYSVFFLLVLMFCIALICFIESLMRFRQMRTQGQKLLSVIGPCLEKKDWQAATELCQQAESSFGEIAKAGLIERAYLPAKSVKQIEEVLTAQAAYEIRALARPMDLLYMIAHITPVIGLCAASFTALTLFTKTVAVQEMGVMLQQVILGFIYGLIVCVVSLMGYYVLTLRFERCALDVQELSEQLLRAITSTVP